MASGAMDRSEWGHDSLDYCEEKKIKKITQTETWIPTREPTNWWGSAKRDDIHPRTTAITCSKTFMPAHALSSMCDLTRQQHESSPGDSKDSRSNWGQFLESMSNKVITILVMKPLNDRTYCAQSVFTNFGLLRNERYTTASQRRSQMCSIYIFADFQPVC